MAQRGEIALDRAAEAAARRKLRHLLSIAANFDVYRDCAGRPLVNLPRC